MCLGTTSSFVVYTFCSQLHYSPYGPGPAQPLIYTMQKLLKRTAQVQKQAARRSRTRSRLNASDQRRLLIGQHKQVNQARKELLYSARQALREDWQLGPLAPRRDVGDNAKTYGTVPIRVVQAVDNPLGKWKKWGIRVGDRVCVTGDPERDRGKIGVVGEVTEKAESCKVRGINRVCVQLPIYLLLPICHSLRGTRPFLR